MINPSIANPSLNWCEFTFNTSIKFNEFFTNFHSVCWSNPTDRQGNNAIYLSKKSLPYDYNSVFVSINPFYLKYFEALLTKYKGQWVKKPEDELDCFYSDEGQPYYTAESSH